VRDCRVGADAHILVDSELDAAHADEARTAGRQALARFVEIRLLPVGVRREARAQVGSNARHAPRPEAVAGRDLERRNPGCKRNAETEVLPIGAKRALTGFLEARGANLDVVLALKSHLKAATKKRRVRLSEDRFECFTRRERVFRAHDVRPERNRRLGWQRW